MALKLSRAGGVRVSLKVRRAIDKADAARDARDWTHAVDLYRHVLELDPSLAAIWLQYGHMLAAAGEAQGALSAYETAASRSPSDPDAAFSLAEAKLASGDRAGALEGSQRSIEIGLSEPHRMDALQHQQVLSAPLPVESSVRCPVLPDGVTLAEMQAKLDELIWHHSIDFGDGLVSKSQAPVAFINATAEALFDGLDLRDRSLIDIGAWSGAYSFEAKRRGACRVLATDKFAWTHPVFKGRLGFDLGLQLTGLQIEAREIDVPDITEQSVGLFDVVLFSGVFYHLLDPITLMRQISTCAEHLLIVETHQDALDCPRPSMIFYPGDVLNNDGSNWWGPNPQCMYELLREFGFSEVHYRDAPLMDFRSRGIFHAYRSAESMAKLGVRGAPDGWLSLAQPEARAELFTPVG